MVDEKTTSEYIRIVLELFFNVIYDEERYLVVNLANRSNEKLKRFLENGVDSNNIRLVKLVLDAIELKTKYNKILGSLNPIQINYLNVKVNDILSKRKTLASLKQYVRR